MYMAKRAKVAERGQVTIPKALRKQLGIMPGTVLDFDIDAGRLVATKVLQDDPVSRVYGCVEGVVDVDTWLDELRGSDS